MNGTINDATLYEKLGANLKLAREALGITQGRLARQVGIARTSITNIEAGQQKLPIHLLFQLCDVLQIEVVNVLPSLKEVRRSEMEEVEVNGQLTVLPRQAATIARELIEDL